MLFFLFSPHEMDGVIFGKKRFTVAVVGAVADICVVVLAECNVSHASMILRICELVQRPININNV